jgi:DNA-binding CsgD family transcriptional regulator
MHLLEARRCSERIGVGDPGVVPFHGDLLDALVAADRHVEAAEIAEQLAESAARLDRPRALAASTRGSALVAAARGDLGAALAALESAMIHQERLDDPFDRARTLLLLGSVRRRAKKKRGAVEALELAQQTFHDLGAAGWVERCEEELARVGSRPGGTDATELTATERLVAQLACEGLTNKEISIRLSVTVRTVESNLTRIYRKLAIRSRTELVRRFGADGSNDVVLTDSKPGRRT